MQKGRVTISTDENYVEGTKKIAALWGADAIRDCDGTHLPKNALEIGTRCTTPNSWCVATMRGQTSTRTNCRACCL